MTLCLACGREWPRVGHAGWCPTRGEPFEVIEMGNLCECDLRFRQWNPGSGRCETCGQPYARPPSAEDVRAATGYQTDPNAAPPAIVPQTGSNAPEMAPEGWTGVREFIIRGYDGETATRVFPPPRNITL